MTAASVSSPPTATRTCRSGVSQPCSGPVVVGSGRTPVSGRLASPVGATTVERGSPASSGSTVVEVTARGTPPPPEVTGGAVVTVGGTVGSGSGGRVVGGSVVGGGLVVGGAVVGGVVVVGGSVAGGSSARTAPGATVTPSAATTRASAAIAPGRRVTRRRRGPASCRFVTPSSDRVRERCTMRSVLCTTWFTGSSPISWAAGSSGAAGTTTWCVPRRWTGGARRHRGGIARRDGVAA